MAQSNPQASYTDPQQPRRSSRLPKPAYRDPNFIYEDLQRQLDNFDDVDERYLLPSPSLFSDLQDHDRKETKRKVKRTSSKQPTKVSDPGRQFAELQSKVHNLNLYDLGQGVLSSTDQKRGKITQSPSTHHQLPQPSASPERDIQHEIRLEELRKEQLALAVQLVRLRHAPSSSSDCEPGEKRSSSVSAGAIRKKRAVDWPHEFAPGTSNSIDSDKIDLPQFVAGFLAMIKTYDIAKKCVMLDQGCK